MQVSQATAKTILTQYTTRTLFTDQKLVLVVKVVFKACLASTHQPSNGRNYRPADLVTGARNADKW